MQRNKQLALEFMAAVGFMSTVGIGVQAIVHHTFWQVAIHWCLFGYVVMAGFSYYNYRKHHKNIGLLKMHLIWCIGFAFFWPMFSVFWLGYDTDSQKKSSLNGNHA